MKRLLRSSLQLVLAGAILSGIFIAVAPAKQALARCGDPPNFFSIPPWHEYITACDAEGGVDNINFELQDIWLIAAAIMEAFLKISAIAALLYVIYGGFKYITSQGSPDGTAKARRTIINAMAGLVIAVLASAAVTLFMDVLAGGTDSGGTLLPRSTTDQALTRILNFIYAIAGAVATVYVALGTVKFVTSTGDPGKAASARNTITYALVGIVVIVSAYFLTTAVLGNL